MIARVTESAAEYKKAGIILRLMETQPGLIIQLRCDVTTSSYLSTQIKGNSAKEKNDNIDAIIKQAAVNILKRSGVECLNPYPAQEIYSALSRELTRMDNDRSLNISHAQALSLPKFPPGLHR